MITKTKIAEQLTARFKFKSCSEIELTVTDVKTGEIFTIFWDFRNSVHPEVTKEEVADNDQ